MKLRFIDDPEYVTKVFVYTVSRFSPNLLEYLPLSSEDMFRAAFDIHAPLKGEIDVSKIEKIMGNDIVSATRAVEELWKEYEKVGTRLLERRFGKIDKTFSVVIIPANTPHYHEERFIPDIDSGTIVLTVQPKREKEKLKILFHELAHGIILAIPEAKRFFQKKGKEFTEAVISFFWPGIDAGALGIGNVTLENVKKEYNKLYVDTKVSETLKELLPILIEYVQADSDVPVWQWLEMKTTEK